MLNFRGRTAARHPIALPPINGAGDRMALLLARWVKLAHTQQHEMEQLGRGIARLSDEAQSAADERDEHVAALAGTTRRHTERIGGLTTLAGELDFEGRTVTMAEVAGIIAATLDDVMAKIVLLSRNAMAMVYSLERTASNLDKTEQCMAQIDVINGKTNMLAMNAMIEAVRSVENGKAFRVIANEIRELSKLTKGLAHTMRQELGSVVAGVREGHASLREVASIEMADNILGRDRLDRLVAALAQRNDTIGVVAAETAQEIGDLPREIDQVLAGKRFPDRAAKQLAEFAETLTAGAGALAALRHETLAALPGHPERESDEI
jgi:methyl-accepting chemotaxis protein